MSEETKKKRRRLLTILMFGALAATVAYMAYNILVVKTLGLTYKIVISVAFFLVWLIGQVLTPILLKEFEGKTQEQKTAYYVYAGLGLAGFAGLVYYALSLNSETGIYGVVVYAATMFAKRKIYDDFVGDNAEEDDEEAISGDETESVAQAGAVSADEESGAETGITAVKKDNA